MRNNLYKDLPPLERRPDGSLYRMNPAQRKQANALIRRECCNCENGNDTLWTLWNYGEIYKEFIQHPEMFSVTDISKFIDMLDDDCYQPSFMDDTLKVIRSIIRFHGKDGAIYLLSHLQNVPEQGKEYGLCRSLRYLIVDNITFPYLKEAIALADDSIRNMLSRILHGEISGVTSPLKYAEGVERERICELEVLISSTSENK